MKNIKTMQYFDKCKSQGTHAKKKKTPKTKANKNMENKHLALLISSSKMDRHIMCLDKCYFGFTNISLGTFCLCLSHKEYSEITKCFICRVFIHVFICCIVFGLFFFFVCDAWKRTFAKILDYCMSFIYKRSSYFLSVLFCVYFSSLLLSLFCLFVTLSRTFLSVYTHKTCCRWLLLHWNKYEFAHYLTKPL